MLLFVHFKFILFSTWKGSTLWKHHTEKSKLLFPASLLKIPWTDLGISINVKSSCCAVHWELPESCFLWNSIDRDKIIPKVNLVLATMRKYRITVNTVVLASECLAY